MQRTFFSSLLRGRWGDFVNQPVSFNPQAGGERNNVALNFVTWIPCQEAAEDIAEDSVSNMFQPSSNSTTSSYGSSSYYSNDAYTLSKSDTGTVCKQTSLDNQCQLTVPKWKAFYILCIWIVCDSAIVWIIMMCFSLLVSCRFCGSCESSNDLLSQQPSADPLHDPRIQKCHVQVRHWTSCLVEHWSIQ